MLSHLVKDANMKHRCQTNMIEYRFTFNLQPSNISHPYSDSFNYQTEELVMDRFIIVGKCCYGTCRNSHLNTHTRQTHIYNLFVNFVTDTVGIVT